MLHGSHPPTRHATSRRRFRRPDLPWTGRPARFIDDHIHGRPILRCVPQDVSPVDAVLRFAAALREIRGDVLADLSPVVDVADLLTAVRARRELPRAAVTSSGMEYTVHGAGCRMIAADGREVDVDLVTDPVRGQPVEAFDVWRIRWFLDEAADDSYSNDDILTACTHLARAGHLREIVPGRWFALSDAPGRAADT